MEQALLFRVFQASRGKREAGMEGELRVSRAPRLTRACLPSPEKRQKTTTTTTTTTTTPVLQNKEKREKTGENDKICSRAVGGINHVYLHDV